MPLSFDPPTVALNFKPDLHADRPPDSALEPEWLLTNGLGGFAMGTPMGVNTRRYHGLLIAAANPPVARMCTLSSVIEGVTFDGQTVELANHEFYAHGGGTVFHPKGFHYLQKFEKDLAARWTFNVGPLIVTKELRLVWRRQLAVLTYRIEPAFSPSDASTDLPPEVKLTLTPLLAMRDFHHLRQGWASESPRVIPDGASHRIEVNGWPALHMLSSTGQFIEHHDTWQRFAHRVESARHSDDCGDLFAPGRYEKTFTDCGDAVCEFKLYFGIEPIDVAACDKPDGRAGHLALQVEHVRKEAGENGPWNYLALAADDFIVERRVDSASMATILAGYPWFADWGRDTMISLPGLMLATGRFDDARTTLHAYARHIRRGLVPNHFDDYGGEPHYNTVDASLWFINAALKYRAMSGDEASWCGTFADACRQIIDAYQHGTDGPVKMDRDGLIYAGSIDTQLTWMDAKRDGVVFTPRFGKSVEINALWYNALVGCAEAMHDCEVSTAVGATYRKLAAKVKKSFNATFWWEDKGHLLDHVNEHGTDFSLRPNQVIAVSLPHSPLVASRKKKVMQAVREQLLTPMGLRTLPDHDWHYHGHYAGSMFDRDRSYHQGTVWAWLIGPYVEGWLRAHDFSPAAKKHARQAIAPLLNRLMGPGLGQLHEIYDGNAPHRPDGCPAQAWSVAETLRAAMLIESRQD